MKRVLGAEGKKEMQGECCVCLKKLAARTLLALVPCGHRCVCVDHAADTVGRPCPICRAKVTDAIRVFD